MVGIFKRIKEAKSFHDHAKATQAALQREFSAFGVNFTNLHPTIHKSVLREATVLGVEYAVQQFEAFAVHVSEEEGTDDQKAQRLIDLYRERERAVNEALKQI